MDRQTVTVLATRWENTLLVQHVGAGLDLLVDFGFCAGHIDFLEHLLARRRTSIATITAVLMTHLHGDHFDSAGLGEFLRRRSAGGAPELPVYVHRDEPGAEQLRRPGTRLVRLQERAFAVAGAHGTVEVRPVRLTHTAGTCGFRIGPDYIGADSSLREVFGERVMRVLDAEGGPVRRLYLDMEAIDEAAVLAADMTPQRRRVILTEHGMVSHLVEAMERRELRPFFSQLQRLTCLHVTPDVNDPSGRENARLITQARDRLGFTFEVPVVPAGIQEL